MSAVPDRDHGPDREGDIRRRVRRLIDETRDAPAPLVDARTLTPFEKRLYATGAWLGTGETS